MTCNDKCAHYIEKPTIYSHETKDIIRFSYIYVSEQIEYKLNKEKLESYLKNFENHSSESQIKFMLEFKPEILKKLNFTKRTFER